MEECVYEKRENMEREEEEEGITGGQCPMR
jgi:hypothetical protein